MVPDKDMKMTDVVLGYSSLDNYLTADKLYFGAVCGRFANRIANGRFTLDGVLYDKLAVNNGPNHLHGGIKGFDSVVWDMQQVNSQAVELRYISNDGEEGFPGTLETVLTYRLTDDNELVISYKATTDKPTVLNLSNHTYFNLSGAGDPSIYDHQLQINADYYLPTDKTNIPFGPPEEVINTPMDFTVPFAIGERIDDNFEQLVVGAGYDHTYIIDKIPDEWGLAARCSSPKTGILMEVITTQPGVQLYTGNWLTGNDIGKSGHRYPRRSAVCFETQHYPDSPNKPDYPSCVLRPGEVFENSTVYKFSLT
jgi:aldose 1-epimerase